MDIWYLDYLHTPSMYLSIILNIAVCEDNLNTKCPFIVSYERKFLAFFKISHEEVVSLA